MSSLLANVAERQAWPGIILAGVALVTMAVLTGGHAALTGVALIACGGLGELESRSHSPGKLAWLFAHSVTYLVIYLVFLGARIDLGGDWLPLASDLLVSAVVLAACLPLGSHSPRRKS
ncbi:MAG: hypothetical protein KDA37_14900 [Planctomycetales bacterium]|nr:hypothetical protein [Planctomycetales bacterium]